MEAGLVGMADVAAASVPRGIVEKMFMKAMRGKWHEVAEIYADSEEVRAATMIQTGDTVLHLAVSSGVESNVKLLMDSIPTNCSREILEMANKSGDVPLHLAAALGMREACRDMVERCPELVTKARNKQGETPLFKAARHGQDEAFRVMRDAFPDASNSRDLVFCRNLVGDTILHVALLQEHYGT